MPLAAGRLANTQKHHLLASRQLTRKPALLGRQASLSTKVGLAGEMLQTEPIVMLSQRCCLLKVRPQEALCGVR